MCLRLVLPLHRRHLLPALLQSLGARQTAKNGILLRVRKSTITGLESPAILTQRLKLFWEYRGRLHSQSAKEMRASYDVLDRPAHLLIRLAERRF